MASTSASQNMTNIPIEIGNPLPINAKKQIQRQVNALVGWNETERAPMSIAMPMLRVNESQIAEHPYFVCEKSTGTR
jgi:hypothetical protein